MQIRGKYRIYTVISFFFSLLFIQKVSGQNSIKFMSYNLLNYPVTSDLINDTTTRHPSYRTIVSAINPDILLTQETNSSAGVGYFLSRVMNANGNVYSAATFIDGPDTDNGCFYKTSKFNFISNTAIKTALRDINEFKLVHIPTGDTIRIFSLHLKASSGATNEALRAAEVDSLRKYTNSLPIGSKFIVCGDFNIYGSTESAYTKLLQVTAGNTGHFYDPITISGIWNNPAYALYHTQSPRIRSFGGGSTGGLDDRFDMILFSKAINDGIGMSYQTNSMTAYGNDGNHYNDSINRMPNTAVSATIANAIHNSSDHLPVYATFNFSTLANDVGAIDFIPPTVGSCNNNNKTLKVSIRNFGASSLNFSNSPVSVGIRITDPSNVVQTLTTNVTTGTLAANGTLSVVVSSTYNFNQAGNYLFKAFTQTAGDININNDSAIVETVAVPAAFTASISPAGSITICNGASQTLTATSGTSYLWSTGSTTSSINVSTAGTYTVTVTNVSGCTSISGPVVVNVSASNPTTVLFSESMGTVLATTTIAAHESANGFDNDSFTMSGTGDVRATTVSSGYPTASSGANVFLTAATGGRNFIISNINSSGLSNLQLSFGIWKNANTATGSDFEVLVSTDGVTYTNLNFTPISGVGNAWYYRTATGTIPSTSNLRIQFRNNSTTNQYRIDDVLLNYTLVPTITASGPTTFCNGDSVTLTASSGSTYLWSNGASTQSIKAKVSGNYTVIVDCVPSATQSVTVNNCNIILQTKLFLQGFNVGGGIMQNVLYANGLSADPFDCDSITIELHQAVAPYSIISSKKTLLKTNGFALTSFSPSLLGQNFYVVIKHRNSIEIWTKNPILFTGSFISLDFTTL